MSILNTGSQFPVKPAEEILPLVLTEKEIIFADLETTGFSDYDDITEIGAVRVNIEAGKIVDRFSTFVHLKNRQTVPAKITELTSITTEKLQDAPSMEQALTEFYKYIGNTVLSFHNASFDWRMLQKRYHFLGKTLTNEVVCTLRLFKYLHPERRGNLDEVCEYYGKPIVGHHRAVVDCAWSAACYRKMREELLERQKCGQLSFAEHTVQKRAARDISLQELRETCRILRISGWKKGKLRRIYVTTNIADVYYDIPGKVWNVTRRKVEDNLNLDVFSKYLLELLNLSTTEFEKKYQPAA